ncbi:cornifelin homolog B-like isoform X2 [Pygocentrus nattereri]|uniref:cornifelin homolog B-like isoform X2 n=1 Tax=Pygocentrus nattereri TaxID=42514 RepID=UPI001890CED2|nr:cornifelin homolog B-like isoform X2 [Pygocentrus nattereri]
MAKTMVQQPQAVALSQWSSGCYSFWCLPCIACSTAKNHGECFWLPLLEFGFIPPITLSMRTSVRERYHIEGSVLNDCVYSSFCCPCVWCQMSREINIRKESVKFTNRQAK